MDSTPPSSNHLVRPFGPWLDDKPWPWRSEPQKADHGPCLIFMSSGKVTGPTYITWTHCTNAARSVTTLHATLKRSPPKKLIAPVVRQGGRTSRKIFSCYLPAATSYQLQPWLPPQLQLFAAIQLYTAMYVSTYTCIIRNDTLERQGCHIACRA